MCGVVRGPACAAALVRRPQREAAAEQLVAVTLRHHSAVENRRANVAAAGLGEAEGSQPVGKGGVDIIERGEPAGANAV